MNIFGCNFHFVQCVLTWVKEKQCSFCENEDLLQDLITDLRNLSRTYLKSEEFDKAVLEFCDVWSIRDNRFVSYMKNTWLKNNAGLPPKLWSVSQSGIPWNIDKTDNESERFFNWYEFLYKQGKFTREWNNCIKIIRWMENRVYERKDWEDRNIFKALEKGSCWTRDVMKRRRNNPSKPLSKKRKKIPTVQINQNVNMQNKQQLKISANIDIHAKQPQTSTSKISNYYTQVEL